MKHSENKKQIAQAAAALIKNNSQIIIDCGTTTLMLIPELAEKEGLVVMTNSLLLGNAINELETPPKLLMTGGTWDVHSQSFQGNIAEKTLKNYNFDQLFIGADGIELELGTTTFNELIGLSQVMANISQEVIVMLESIKIGKKIPNIELTWDNVDILITDDNIPELALNILLKQGIKVILTPYIQK